MNRKTHILSTFITGVLLFPAGYLPAQNISSTLEPLFTAPKSYVVEHTSEHIATDGKLQESAWSKVAWTSDFVDIEGDKKPLPALRTQVKMLWNDSTLFIAAKLQEPQVWAKQQHHDDIIFRDNDFEVFIDPDNNTHQYFEIEINALNKIFDLFLPKPYRNGGDALIGWDVAGLKTGVQVQGTLNNTSDKDQSWTVEMAVPLKQLRMGFPFHVPAEGTLWRINFSRVEWKTQVVNGDVVKLKDANGRELPENNWVWSPQGVINMHFPERWGYLQFTRKENTTFTLPYAEKQKRYLWQIYYLQKEYFEQHHQYVADLKTLGVDAIAMVDGQTNKLTMQATLHQFNATVSSAGTAPISINDEGLIQTQKVQP